MIKSPLTRGDLGGSITTSPLPLSLHRRGKASNFTNRSGDKELHLILGGRYMGKRTYAMKLYKSFEAVYDLDNEAPESITQSGLIINIHSGAKNLLSREINPSEFFLSRLEILNHCVITGCEIGSGVVPLDAFSRKWRDETGKLYQVLADKADIVDRIFAGLPLRLKGADSH